METDFIWHDGGRAGAGFVGYTGDCVVRAAAIATGEEYRQVYDWFSQAAEHSPREGLATKLLDQFLSERGFRQVILPSRESPENLNFLGGIIVLRLAPSGYKRTGHVCTVVDGTIYDTWNALCDGRFLVDQYWIAPASDKHDFKVVPSARKISKRQQANSDAMARVVERIRKMRNTASNAASTEGEIENALRMASTMMLQYQLTEEDIRENKEEGSTSFGSIQLTVTGTRATEWEKSLAVYVSNLCGDVFWFFTSANRRTEFVFYGPIDSVESGVSLFRELLLEIATLAKLKYGGYAKGSGASYAEGFVRGLQDMLKGSQLAQPALIESNKQLRHRDERAATRWLCNECGIVIENVRSSERSRYDAAAAEVGKSDGRARNVAKPGRLRLDSQ